MLEVERAPDPLADCRPPLAPRPGADRLVPRLDVVQRRDQQERKGVGEDEWSKSPSACSVIHSHSLSSTILRGRSSSMRPSRESNTHIRTRPRSRQKLQRLPSFAWSAPGESRSSGPASSAPFTRSQQLVLGERCRRQVADVLVDPVRGERALDPLLPPRLGAHLLEPCDRRVPVVVHVVVVEDHRDADRREQPADHVGSPTTPSRGACTPRSRRPPRPAAGWCRAGRG